MNSAGVPCVIRKPVGALISRVPCNDLDYEIGLFANFLLLRRETTGVMKNKIYLSISDLLGKWYSISYRKFRKELPIKGRFIGRIMITGFAKRFL